MKVQDSARKAGVRDHGLGVPKTRNPFQYTSNIFKQAAWLTGWNQAEKEHKK
jgi:ribosome modulation factor